MKEYSLTIKENILIMYTLFCWHLTLKKPISIAADALLLFYLYLEVRLDVSCESTAS